MFVEGSIYGRPEEPRLYSQVADYGIQCKVQDLADIVQEVNRYLKKNKIRTSGMAVRFGVSNSGYQTKEKCWTEWIMDVFIGCRSHNLPEQGGYFFFQMIPNRHFHIKEDGSAQEVYLVPGREDLPYVIRLKKDLYYLLRDGQFIDLDTPEDKEKREKFFQGLLNSIGRPLELLHQYQPMESPLGCPLWGSWFWSDQGWVPGKN